MSSSYIQHEYSVNQPWSINSTNTEDSILDGDEELLVLDQSRLGFDDNTEEDYCRCVKCVSTNRIAMISNGNIMDETRIVHDAHSNHLEPTNTHSHHHHSYRSTEDSHDHDHDWNDHCHPNSTNDVQKEAAKKANRQLTIGCILCLVFMIAEVIGGYLSNSLAIMTDAAHILSDLASFLLSLFAIWISQRKPTKKMSFGFYRAEVLGAVASIFLIWILTGVLIYLAIERIITKDYDINADYMLIISGSGVAVNIIMGIVLSGNICGGSGGGAEAGHGHGHGHGHSHGLGGHGHSHASHGHSHANMNVRAALIHVLGDLIQSVGVLIAAYIIKYKPDYKIVDPICTFLFSFLVLFTTFNIMKDAVYVLMEGFPPNLDYTIIKEALQHIEGVKMTHSLHIWSLTLNKNALSVHLAIDSRSDPQRILKLAESLIRKEYEIQQTTIQVEKYDAMAMNNCNTCKGP